MTTVLKFYEAEIKHIICDFVDRNFHYDVEPVTVSFIISEGNNISVEISFDSPMFEDENQFKP